MTKKRAGAPPPARRQPPPPSADVDDLIASSSSPFWRRAALLLAVLVALCAYYFASSTTTTTPIKPRPPPPPPRLTLAQVKQRAAAQPCKDRHVSADDFCARQAASGECASGKGWMAVMCAASCARCDLLDPAVRCSEEHMGVKLQNALQPGDLNSMFERLAQLPNVDVLHRGEPWVLLVRDFISEKESSTLLRLTVAKLKRSTDQGEFDADGFQSQVVSQHRTSSNSWCQHECEANPTVRNLTRRISALVGVPVPNFEQFQVLQYELAQKYDLHHDSNPEDVQRVAGPRVLTFFMYLSDVEEGGETAFPQLGLKVKPVKGAAVLWPSVKSARPGEEIEPLTSHAALPVIKGTKYAANSWIHLREYKTPNEWGCTGSFD